MDKIVTAASLRDFVIVITEHGVIYRIGWDASTERIEISLEAKLELCP